MAFMMGGHQERKKSRLKKWCRLPQRGAWKILKGSRCRPEVLCLRRPGIGAWHIEKLTTTMGDAFQFFFTPSSFRMRCSLQPSGKKPSRRQAACPERELQNTAGCGIFTGRRSAAGQRPCCCAEPYAGGAALRQLRVTFQVRPFEPDAVCTAGGKHDKCDCHGMCAAKTIWSVSCLIS